ncbi:hypothetical protein DASC09_033040 [Saccharomycopsis crataegensis]|uniref:Homing endonuclease LAGLIDADG domain-containing protein n=1 Tax=Saccharomycopsis crataegensis TaxID=43959 RepID=A0AAV5QML1_9ASCO|nr:hypothetical protein DASC09_033040 [Saccharomycopsis crataegensis]
MSTEKSGILIGLKYFCSVRIMYFYSNHMKSCSDNLIHSKYLHTSKVYPRDSINFKFQISKKKNKKIGKFISNFNVWGGKGQKKKFITVLDTENESTHKLHRNSLEQSLENSYYSGVYGSNVQARW